MLEIRLEGKLPIYEQLVKGIALQIVSGELKPEERLPAVREVAKALGINPNTVQKAYSMLEQQGLTYSIPAKGSFVASGTEAADALKAGALRTLEAALVTAQSGGITRDEVVLMADKIWSTDRKGGES